MTILHEAYTALLSGVTHKTGNEIHWQDENGNPITIESIDIKQCKYIVRNYYNNGQKYLEEEYKNRQQHGKTTRWYENGQKIEETEYKNGQLHGKKITWYINGQKCREADYQNGRKHGKSMGWYNNGKKIWEKEYRDGELIK